MNKAFLFFSLGGLLIGGIFQPAHAKDVTSELNINAGALATYKFREILFTIGAGLDYHLGEYFMISPELQLWNSELRLSALQLNLSTTLNCKLKNFFVGAGASIPLFKTEDLAVFKISGMKMNAGLRTKKIKLTIYLITSFEGLFPSFNRVQYGSNIGIVF